MVVRFNESSRIFLSAMIAGLFDNRRCGRQCRAARLASMTILEIITVFTN